MFTKMIRVTVVVLKHSIKWAAILGIALGVIGSIVGLIAQVELRYLWMFAAFGAYLGLLFGMGQGIKALFGKNQFDPYRADTDGNPAVAVGDWAAGAVLPGWQVVSFLGFLIGLVVSLRKVDLASPDPDRVQRAALEAVAWSIIATGMILLLFVISFQPTILYGLLFVPVVAFFGPLAGADSSAKLNQSRKE